MIERLNLKNFVESMRVAKLRVRIVDAVVVVLLSDFGKRFGLGSIFLHMFNAYLFFQSKS